MSKTQTQTITEQDDRIVIPNKSVDPSESIKERLTSNAYNAILPARYLNKDANGNTVETQEELFERVAQNIAEAEYEYGATDAEVIEWREEFHDMMAQQEFIPNSPTLMNAGDDLQQLSACFVDSPSDSMEGIFGSAKEAAQIFKSGGGIGYAFHTLRPKGEPVSSTGGEASGPVSFMQVFDSTCQTVKQGGVRRGAQMGILRVDHADIGRFCMAKRTEGNLSNFNISVALTDEFLDGVERDTEYTFYTPTTDFDEPQTVNRRIKHFFNTEYEDAWNDELDKPGADEDGVVVEENFWRDYAHMVEGSDEYRGRTDLEIGDDMTLPAQFVWMLIVDGAHHLGEPGIFYYDETNREHSFDVDEYPEHVINATNPCAEQPLCEYEACNLGHINLSYMVREDAPTWEEFGGKEHDSLRVDANNYVSHAVDTEYLDDLVDKGVRFLDNVITQSEFPLEEIHDRVEGMRKIGLGVMGLHQMLIQMGIEYGSPESYYVSEAVMRHIDQRSKQASHELALERGSFDYWDQSKYAEPTKHSTWFFRHAYQNPSDWTDGYPIRNHNTTTIAPTGTTSMIGNTTGGCEPIYNVAYFKNVGDDIQGEDYLVEFDDYFLRTLEANGIDTDEVKDEAISKMKNNEFDGVGDLDTVPDAIARLFVTTQDLDGEQHVRMQRHLQSAVDSGISKTINMPNHATRDEVDRALRLAVSRKPVGGSPIKGTTVYRDGSRDEQVQTTRIDNKLDDETDIEGFVQHLVDERNISVKAEHTLRSELDIETNGDSVRTCDSCGSGQLDLAEGCPVCVECGYTPCT